MWVFLTRFGVKPYEMELISLEDQNVLWTIMQYENERKEHDEWKRESKNTIEGLVRSSGHGKGKGMI